MNRILLLISITAVLAAALASCTGLKPTDDRSGTTAPPDSGTAIAVDQVGYLIGADKYFITAGGAQDFQVLAADGSVAASGKTARLVASDASTGRTTWIGDFSALETPGRYRVRLRDGTESHPFDIGRGVYEDVARKALKSFYYQRCGMALTEEHAGEFAHGACHTAAKPYHPASGFAGSMVSNGGWHDAGDYGRYVHAAAASVGNMLLAYESKPDSYAWDDLGIPESGNGLPDFLDEMAWELDWMLTMQVDRPGHALDGGVHYMLNTKDYVWDMPDADGEEQFVHAVSSVAAADFAAVLAQAARIFGKVPGQEARAAAYLKAARRAWAFLEAHPGLYPEGGFARPADTSTGGYAESADRDDKDDRAWAAAELFVSTGEAKFHEAFRENPRVKSLAGFDSELGWMDTLGFGLLDYMLRDREGQDAELKAAIRTLFLRKADRILSDIGADGYRDALTSYYWGSNGGVMNLALYLAFAHELTGRKDYREGALAQLHYLLGTNAHGMSFVSGVGAASPRNIHHAQLASDGIDAIFPGLVPGGPNPDLGADPVLERTFRKGTPPALCYVDHVDSYASNENCILYNAPLTAALGLILSY